MLIIYKNGEIRNQIIAWGADKERRVEGRHILTFSTAIGHLIGISELEAILLVTGALHISERPPPPSRRDDDSEDDDDDDDPSLRMRSAPTSTNGKAKKNIRNRAKGDNSDSDFDFDL